ncbi:MAG: hypothetical protein JW889_03065 [Verrucomicrobia bacterium]|nr:hypothetical protein [Verrucomicrobiota bacterium]
MIVQGDFGPFETTMPERWHSWWARGLSIINTPDIGAAVAKAPEVLKRVDLTRLSPNECLMLGHALLLGGRLNDAWTVLASAAEEASKENVSFAQWIWCSAAWAAWLAGDEAKLKQATDEVFTVVEADWSDKATWNMRHWCAGWISGEATEQEFLAGCTRQPWNHGAPFFVAERLLRDRKLDEAKAAYERCVRQCEAVGDPWPLGWAKWRVKQLEAKQTRQ